MCRETICKQLLGIVDFLFRKPDTLIQRQTNRQGASENMRHADFFTSFGRPYTYTGSQLKLKGVNNIKKKHQTIFSHNFFIGRHFLFLKHLLKGSKSSSNSHVFGSPGMQKFSMKKDSAIFPDA